MVQAGSEDDKIEAFLSRYEALSSHIKVQTVDPVEFPNFAAQYTDELKSNNSLIVVSGERSKYVDSGSIYLTDYSNYYVDGSYSVTFNGESSLTSAIDYVTNAELPKLYTLSGHGEDALAQGMSTAIANQNYITEELSLLTSSSVPDDCDCLLINSPSADISAEEKDIILAYLEEGGRMLLATDMLEGGLPNIKALMENYGAILNDGVVVEGDPEHCLRGYEYYLLPYLNAHAIVDPLLESGYRVLIPVAQGITVSDTLRDGLTVSKLFTTSDKAFSKVAGYNMTTTEFEEGDIRGTFALGVAVEENETRIVWLSSGGMLTDEISQMVGGANQDVFLNSLNWMCEREQSISISPKSLDELNTLTVPTGAGTKLSILLVGVIPAAFVACGIAITVRRRRK
jgi:ABC-2 type transport system permease protein